MFLKPPNLSGRLFDKEVPNKLLEGNGNQNYHQDISSLVGGSARAREREIENYHKPRVNPNKKIYPSLPLPTNQLQYYCCQFNKLNYPTKKIVLQTLLNQFGPDLDIREQTTLYQLWWGKTVIALVCCETDEQVGQLFRAKGFRHIQNLGIRSDGVYLYNLWVNPFYRKQGAAKILIKQLEQTIKKVGKRSIRLQIAADNIPSLRLFRPLGYLEEGRFRDQKNKIQINLSKWLS